MTETLLSDEQITSGLSGSRWERDGDAIIRELELKDFSAVIAAVNRVAAVAEEQNHHPDILVHGWNKLRLRLTNHAAGGLTQTDFETAERLDGVI